MPVKTVQIQVTALTDKANRDLAATSAYFEKLRAANPVELRVKLDRAQAIAEARILAKEMSQTVRDTIKLDMERSGIGRFFFGADPRGRGGGLSGLLGSLGSGLGSAGGALGPTAIGLGIGAAGALTPALLPTLLGGGIGALGLFGALMAAGGLQKDLFSQQALANTIASLQQRIGAASTASQLAAVPGLRRTLALDLARYQAGTPVGQLRAMFAQVSGVQGAFQDLGQTGLTTFLGALTSHGPGFSHGPAGPSFLQGVTGILSQLGGFVKTLGPQLGDMFRASLPFLQMFTGILETAAKTILPAVTSALKTMQPFLPIMSQGFAALLQGVGNMIKAIGPRGMHDSAEIFLGLMRAMGGALDVFGKVLNFTAVAVFATAVKLSRWFHWLSHEIAVAFDVSRHDIAHWADDARHDFGKVTSDIMTWAHDIAHWFDVARHDVAAAWNRTWNDTIGTLTRAIARIEVDLGNWATDLYRVGKTALTMLWDGLKSAAGPIFGWFGGFVSKILGFFSRLLHHSPTGLMYAYGKNMMEGLAMGLKDHAHLVTAGIGAAIGGLTGAAGGNVTSWIMQALRITGTPMSWLQGMTTLVMKESGGNPRAYNPQLAGSSGEHAEGIAQTIPSTFARYGIGGSIWNPVADLIASIRYIKAVYGSVYNIQGITGGWYGGYDQGGWLMPGTTVAVNRSGRPERVTSGAAEDAMLARLDELCGLVGQLIGVTAQAPAVMGAAMAGAGRSAAYGNLYP